MRYSDFYKSTDELIAHLQPLISSYDESTKTKYTGFLAVSAVTVYELAIKDVFVNFAKKKNRAFGSYVEHAFKRINGRIRINNLTDYAKQFGIKYSNKFKKNIDKEDLIIIKLRRGYDLKNSYDNLLQCRHDFVHKNQVQLTFDNVVDYYIVGKTVIDCLYKAMQR